jgi:anti-anti-sigma factor
MEHDDGVEVRDAERETGNAALVEIVRRDGVAVLTPEGELDVDSAPMLRSALRDELDADRACIVDLRAVSFVDSSILSALLGGHRYSTKLGLGFGLVLGGPDSAVRRLIELVMIRLPVYDDLDAAVAGATAHPSR